MPQYKILFTDDATTTLAAPITAASPSLQVVSGGGALFPALGSQQAFIATLIKAGAPNIKEVVLVTGRASDNMTGLTRNYSGTGALTWQAGDTFAILQPAEAMAVFAQMIDIQSQLPNYAADTGSANAYRVLLTPAPNGRVVGMPIRFRAAHTNAPGASTFDDGLGAASLVTSSNTNPPGGSIGAGGIYEVIWDGSEFQISSVPQIQFSQILGQILNSQVPSSAVIQWESLLAIAFSQLTGQLQNGQIASSIALPGSPTTTTQGANDSSTKLATTAFANPGASVGLPGYFKLPSGFLVQAGSANPGGGSATVTLPLTYPNAYAIVAVSLASGGVQTWVDSSGKTNSQFVLHNTGGSAFWVTVGY